MTCIYHVEDICHPKRIGDFMIVLESKEQFQFEHQKLPRLAWQLQLYECLRVRRVISNLMGGRSLPYDSNCVEIYQASAINYTVDRPELYIHCHRHFYGFTRWWQAIRPGLRVGCVIVWAVALAFTTGPARHGVSLFVTSSFAKRLHRWPSREVEDALVCLFATTLLHGSWAGAISVDVVGTRLFGQEDVTITDVRRPYEDLSTHHNMGRAASLQMSCSRPMIVGICGAVSELQC